MRKTMRVFSHDLRNPLLNIQALVQEAGILLKGATQAEKAGSKESLASILEHELPEILELLHHSAARMDDMVRGANDIYHCLFDDLACAEVDMHALFLRCFAQLHMADAHFELDCTGLPAVYADEWAVQRMVCEVLSNAKQAIDAADTPCSRVIHVQGEHLGDMVAFHVRDAGCGLTEDEAKQAFDAFFSGVHFQGHAGMGLTRAKALVERHGGQMHIANHADGGAEVIFSLPKEAVDL